MKWVLTHMLRHAGSALGWHTKWKTEAKLIETDARVREHEFLCRVLETMTVYDQLNAGELASGELIARELQLLEERVYEEAMSELAAKAGKAKDKAHSKADDLLVGEASHFLGLSESKANLAICPALTEWIAEQMKAEAAVAKERRKAREERALRA